MNYGVAEADLGAGRPELRDRPAAAAAAVEPRLARARQPDRRRGRPFNDPRFLTAVVPAANIVTNANELSRFFEIFRAGGELDGVRVMEPATIEQAVPSSRAWRSIFRSASRRVSRSG